MPETLCIAQLYVRQSKKVGKSGRFLKKEVVMGSVHSTERRHEQAYAALPLLWLLP